MAGKKYLKALCAVAICLILAACSTTYYATWEKLGKHKRDLLRDNVEEVSKEQSEAQEQFKDALTRLKELQNFQGSELESTYEALKDDYDESVERADAVRDRIEKIDTIANDLFEEWQEELALITNRTFRSDSAAKLRETRQRYDGLRQALKLSESRMDKVLVRFQDNVLYLKHNLNAQVVGGLKAEVISIEREVRQLIDDMQTSIGKADSFIQTL
jgi:hypothetical protein